MLQNDYLEDPWDDEEDEEEYDPELAYWNSDQALMDMYGVDNLEDLEDAQDDDIGGL